MVGHAFWDAAFASRFLTILEREYQYPETVGKFWETIYAEHIRELPMRMKQYPPGEIFEFDTLDELRLFDSSYVTDGKSEVLREIAQTLGMPEEHFRSFRGYADHGSAAAGFTFFARR